MSTFAELINDFGVSVDADRLHIFITRWLHVLVILVLALWLYRVLMRYAGSQLQRQDKDDQITLHKYKMVFRGLVFMPAILLALHYAGIDLSVVFTTGGLFAVALAFAMKNVAENLVSGMMLRGEQAIKPGDILETEGLMVKVKRIGFRATVVRTKDEKDVLFPNSHLVQNKVANYTYRDSICRVWTSVGVSYDSDLTQVNTVLENVCEKLPNLSNQHAPEVHLTEFGASSINYKISVWTEDPWETGEVKSQLIQAIWRGLREAGVVIAYPQLDIHLESPISQIKNM